MRIFSVSSAHALTSGGCVIGELPHTVSFVLLPVTPEPYGEQARCTDGGGYYGAVPRREHIFSSSHATSWIRPSRHYENAILAGLTRGQAPGSTRRTLPATTGGTHQGAKSTLALATRSTTMLKTLATVLNTTNRKRGADEPLAALPVRIDARRPSLYRNSSATIASVTTTPRWPSGANTPHKK